MDYSVFSQNAEQFWQINGPFKTLHDINPVRIEFIEKTLKYQKKTLSRLGILDCGSGAGILSESLALKGANVTAIDISKEVIEVAKKHAEKNNLKIDYHTLSSTQFKKNNPSQFDVITCLEMLEHVEKPEIVIADLAQMLKKNGILFLSTINRTISSFTQSILIGEYLSNMIPKGTHHYNEFIKPSELNDVCISHGLDLLDITGMSYNPITRKAKLTLDCKTNYLAAFIKH